MHLQHYVVNIRFQLWKLPFWVLCRYLSLEIICTRVCAKILDYWGLFSRHRQALCSNLDARTCVQWCIELAIQLGIQEATIELYYLCIGCILKITILLPLKFLRHHNTQHKWIKHTPLLNFLHLFFVTLNYEYNHSDGGDG